MIVDLLKVVPLSSTLDTAILLEDTFLDIKRTNQPAGCRAEVANRVRVSQPHSPSFHSRLTADPLPHLTLQGNIL